MKKKPTPREYAQRLYMADRCTGAAAYVQDTVIIHSRVNAFLDGVNWERRRARATKRR